MTMTHLAKIVFGLALVIPVTASAADKFTLDPAHSTVVFKINHMGMSDFYGRFNDVSGNFVLDKEHPEKSTAEVKIKADSVDTHEAKRDDHLKSPDFFNTKQFPTLTFASTAVKKLSDTEYEVAGNLTVKGVSKPATLKFVKGGEGTDPWGKYRIGFNTSVTIKRSDFGMNFMSDKLGDEVTLLISAEGLRS
jgi:polyisoprenoid-binding protein YceI